MLVWSKRVSARLEEQWRAKVAYLPDEKVVVSGNPATPHMLLIQVFDVTEGEGSELQSAFGGSMETVNEDFLSSAEQGAQEPLKVKDVLLVANSRPTYERARAEFPRRSAILVPPGMAFGTGDHATTLTALRRLAEAARSYAREGKRWRCCDAGCGTGVLAIAAEKLGAAAVDAFDFDATAVEVTRENLQVNECSRVTLWQQDVLEWRAPEQGYDVVLANIYGPVLEEAMPNFRRAIAPGGTLILSGILRTQAPAVWAAAEEVGLALRTHAKVGKWVTGVLG